MKGVDHTPLVTGISPHQGTPGTLVTIRGERLGESPNDLVALIICGCDCLVTAKWHSPSKIIARIGQSKRGPGDIVIMTRLGGRGQSNVQFRVFIEQIGPLQESTVWVDEAKTLPVNRINALRSMTETFESENVLGLPNDKRMDHSLLMKLFPDSSGNLRMENFHPAWYLLESHKHASIAELRFGLNNLRKNLEKEEQTAKNIHKANLYILINCVDALTRLRSKIVEDENSGKNNLCQTTQSILENIGFAKSAADKLFSDVLARKDQADMIRSVNSVLTRFKFIFFLAETIDENTAKLEFSTVLNDYMRARTIFNDTDVELFKEVMEILNIKVGALKEAIRQKIVDLNTSYDDQRKMIKYLKTLDPESDPTWDCLVAYHCWLENIFWHMQRKNYNSALRESSFGNTPGLDKDVSTLPQFLFVSELLSILTEKLNSFLKLAHNFTDSEDVSSEKHKDINQMLTNTINTGSWLLLNILVPTSLPADVVEQYKDQFVKWPTLPEETQIAFLLYSLKALRSSTKALIESQFTRSHIQSLVELCTTVRIKSLDITLYRATQNIVSHGLRESWTTDLLGSAPRTSLPDLYEREINDQFENIGIIISNDGYSGESDLFVKDKIRSLLLDFFVMLILSIKDCYDKIFHAKQEQKRPNKLISDSSEEGRSPKVPAEVNSKKLLLALNNVEHIIAHLLLGICRRLGEKGVKFNDVIYKESRQKLIAFRQQLIQNYVSLRCASISSIVDSARAFYAGNILHDDVSDYIKEIVMCVVFVQSELSLLSPKFSNQILTLVVEFSFCRLTQMLKTVDFDAFRCHTQVIVDITAFEEAFSKFLDSGQSSVLNSIRAKFISELDQESFQLAMHAFREGLKVAIESLQAKTHNVSEQ